MKKRLVILLTCAAGYAFAQSTETTAPDKTTKSSTYGENNKSKSDKALLDGKSFKINLTADSKNSGMENRNNNSGKNQSSQYGTGSSSSSGTSGNSSTTGTSGTSTSSTSGNTSTGEMNTDKSSTNDQTNDMSGQSGQTVNSGNYQNGTQTGMSGMITFRNGMLETSGLTAIKSSASCPYKAKNKDNYITFETTCKGETTSSTSDVTGSTGATATTGQKPSWTGTVEKDRITGKVMLMESGKSMSYTFTGVLVPGDTVSIK
jgi:hypothetical protein